MRHLAPRLSAILLVSTGLAGRAGVGWAAVPDLLVPVVRLADVSARADGWREPAMATIGVASRYVLGPSDVVPIQVRTSESKMVVDSAGRIEIEVACPSEGSVVHNLMIELIGLRIEGKIPVERVTRRKGGLCRDRVGKWVRVGVGGLRPGATVLLAVASMIEKPPAVVESQVVDVPAGAELRLALGVRVEGTPPAKPLDVRLTAVAPDGRRQALASRTVRAPATTPGEWIEWRVPLDEARRALGSRMRVVFESGSHTEQDGLVHVLWGDPTVWAPERGRRAETARNLVLVSIDTLRADRLGAMGYPLALTPNLDRLARDGATFTDVVSMANWTKPSHAAMLTGTFPCVSGVDWGGPAIGGPLPAGIVPIAERLRAAGWVTAAFTEDAYVSPDVFQRGFDVFTADHGPPGVFGDVERTVASAMAWIADNSKRRFFAFVHTYQVHEPYTPPPEYAALVDTDAVPGLPGLPPPAETSMADAKAYLGEIAYTDAVLGRLLASLDELGLTGNTIVVVTSDHGEAFGEHGLRFHGRGLQQEQVHVPLIVRAPGLVAAGRRLDGLVGLVDVTPTVLDLLGFPRPAWMQGLSLAGALRVGGDERVPPGRAFPLRGFGALTGIRGATWKVVFSKRSRIWDLGVDPGERRPKVAGTGTIETMQKAAKAWCDRGRSLVAQAEGEARKLRTPKVSIEEQMKLRALGYVE